MSYELTNAAQLALVRGAMGVDPRHPVRLLLFGDSITEQNTTVGNSAWPNNYIRFHPAGFAVKLVQYSGGRLYLDPSLNKGVGGNNTDDMLARYATDVAANYNSFDLATVLAGFNDIQTAGFSASYIAANLISICDQLVAAGKMVLLGVTMPSGTSYLAGSATKYNKLRTLNRLLRDYAYSKPGVILADWFQDLVNPTSTVSAVASGVTRDEVHPTAAGADLMARRAWSALSAAFPAWMDRYKGAIEAYDASGNTGGNVLPNPGYATGTGGTLSNGSGTLVGNATLSRSSGSWTSGEVVASVVAPTTGYGAAESRTQRLTVAIAGKTTYEEIWFTQFVSGLTAGEQVTFEVDIEATSVTSLKRLSAVVCESDGVSYPVNAVDGHLELTEVPATPTGKVRFKSPKYTVQSSGRTFLFYVAIAFDGSSSAGGTFDISAAKVTKG